MAERQEEKERRKVRPGSEPRRRLVQIGGGMVVACVIVIVLAAAGPIGGDASTQAASHSVPHGGRPVDFPTRTPPIPTRKRTNLAAAAKAAGCRLAHPKLEGSSRPPAHVEGRVAYKTNPPTSGDHNAVWSSDGNYVGVRTPAPEHYVHSLEHGRVELQYKPGTPARIVSQLQSVLKEPTKTDFGVDAGNGRFALLFQNNTKMPYAIAATAWGRLLGCRSATPWMFDAIRAFRTRYTLQAPEKITQAE